MTDSRYGCVYKVTNTVDDKYYIGSTITSLKQRLSVHKSHAKTERHKTKPFLQHMNTIGWDTVIIECLDECDDIKTKEELLKKEDEYIAEHINDSNCLNVIRATPLTPERLKDNRKKIYEKKKDDPAFKEKIKKIRQSEKYKNTCKEYYEKNKEKITERAKEHSKSKNGIFVKCPHCDKEVTVKSLSRHIKIMHGTEEQKKEWKDNDKAYREKNKDKLKERASKERETEERKDKFKKYREEHREHLNKLANERKKEKVKCPKCDKELTKGSLSRHIKTIHKDD